jgi:hypothetical protein
MKKPSIFPMLPKNLSVPQLRKEIRRRICAMPFSRQQVRLMQKAIKELQQENALLLYMLCIR